MESNGLMTCEVWCSTTCHFELEVSAHRQVEVEARLYRTTAGLSCGVISRIRRLRFECLQFFTVVEIVAGRRLDQIRYYSDVIRSRSPWPSHDAGRACTARVELGSYMT